MAKPCDFCGNPVSEMDAYYRLLNKGKANARICGECEFNLRGILNVSDKQKTENSVKWGKFTVNKGKCNPDIETALIEQITTAEKTMISVHGNDVNATNKAPSDNSVKPGNYTKPYRTDYSSYAVNDSSVWTGILKTISALSLVCLIIAGAFIGGMIADGIGILIGLFLGGLIGMICISSVMIFVNMAEDVKATREYAKQIRNMMDESRNDK